MDTMAAAEKKVTRKGSTPIVVRVTPEEKAKIDASAKRVGYSTSSYLRELGLGYEPRGVVDGDKIDELIRINGDFGRLGGLLKLWLTNDERTARFGVGTIRALLSKIEDTQAVMRDVIRTVVRPRSEP